MKTVDLSQYRPAIRFISLFVGIYFAGNVFYGLFIEWYKPRPDPMTVLATKQSAYVINTWSEPASVRTSTTGPVMLISSNGKDILGVFEGCNGLNVMIVFVAFMVAFGGDRWKLLAYIVFGTIIIHVANLTRINLLYYTAIYRPDYFYYFHKYFFTACLYVIVFLLWISWISPWTNKRRSHASA